MRGPFKRTGWIIGAFTKYSIYFNMLYRMGAGIGPGGIQLSNLRGAFLEEGDRRYGSGAGVPPSLHTQGRGHIFELVYGQISLPPAKLTVKILAGSSVASTLGTGLPDRLSNPAGT